jgi:starch synthase (maltosyl-transferring)
MIKVLYCTDTLMSGGTEHQLTELITRLDRSRFEPTVLCLYGEKTGRSLHFAPLLRAAGVPVQVLNIGWSPKEKLRGIQALVQEVWRFRPDILHAVNYHGSLFMRLGRLFMPRHLKLVSAVQIEYTSKQLLYERLSGWMCAAIVVNSPHLQRQLIDGARQPSERVPLIYNGIDTERFAHNPDPGLRARIAPDAARVLIMLGRVTRQKSPHLLAEAVGLMNTRGWLRQTTRVLIVGERENEESQRRLENAIKIHNLENIITQHPQTSQPEAFYHAADITILASLWEGLPNVLLESLAAGRPVVVSEAANAAGVIEHGVTGWVVRTGDIEHLAETLRDILCLPDEHIAALRANCIRAAEKFTMTLMVGRYQQVYENTLRL